MAENSSMNGAADETPATVAAAKPAKAPKARKPAKPAAKPAKAAKTVKASAAAPRKVAKTSSEGMSAVFTFPAFDKISGEFRERFADTAERVRETFGSVGGGLGAARDTASDALEALKKSYGRAGKGVREVNLQALEFVQDDANRFFDMVKAVFGAGSVKEALEIQGDFVRTQFQTQVRQAREIGQMSLEATRDVMTPISETVSDVVSKVRKAA